MFDANGPHILLMVLPILLLTSESIEPTGAQLDVSMSRLRTLKCLYKDAVSTAHLWCTDARQYDGAHG